MNEDLIRRYLDGELDDREVDVFLRTMQEDPEFAAELAAAEDMLRIAGQAPAPDVPATFADGVMDRIALEGGARRAATPPSRPTSPWSRPLLVAASWVLALGLGFFLSRGLPGAPNPTGLVPAGRSGSSAAVLQASDRSPSRYPMDSMRLVRLAYLARDPDVHKVGVAGSFNGWDYTRSPMRLENGYWVADLLLPAGEYDYMFVINDTRWVTDPLAPTTRDDGFGRRNAVLELGI